MYYLSLINGEIGFKVSGIHEILPTDVAISMDIYNEFFTNQAQGIEYEINDINGLTFDDIFSVKVKDAYTPPRSDVDILTEQVSSMQTVLMQMI